MIPSNLSVDRRSSSFFSLSPLPFGDCQPIYARPNHTWHIYAHHIFLVFFFFVCRPAPPPPLGRPTPRRATQGAAGSGSRAGHSRRGCSSTTPASSSGGSVSCLSTATSLGKVSWLTLFCVHGAFSPGACLLLCALIFCTAVCARNGLAWLSLAWFGLD